MSEIKLIDNALKVLAARYLHRNARGEIVETPEQRFAAVAQAVAHAELLLGHAGQAVHWSRVFFELLSSLDFLPNTPTLMNAGRPLGQLSACFVLPVEDTMESIFEAVKQMALVQRTGGGTGFAFSRLRPRGDRVASTGGESSGPVSFMQIFDCATENVKQGGKRRGANMGVLRVDHPDILEFVRAKLDGGTLQNFNVSVGVTDAFMRAVEDDAPYPLVNPRTGEPVGEFGAGAVFSAIVDAAWRTGDPGLLFLDAINRANPTPGLGAIEATNPCGEIPLLPYESCTLGSINLSHMVREGEPRIDWERLQNRVRQGVRFLDDVLEVNRYPIPEIAQATVATRKIGLGVMGFAEMLIRLGISYDSDQAVETAERLMAAIADTALEVSAELAEERGVFAAWKGSRFEAENVRVRHATRVAVAPTGTISIIAGTSPSIEPLFALAYQRRNVLNGQTLYETNPLLLEYIERYGLDGRRILEAVAAYGHLREVPGVPEAMRRLFVTALDIPPRRHLQVQEAFQRHVDNSVSKTINLPQEATSADVAAIYRSAWRMGLKGITIYRYKSKSAQVFELGTAESAQVARSKCDRAACGL